jgi:hypothetical protein
MNLKAMPPNLRELWLPFLIGICAFFLFAGTQITHPLNLSWIAGGDPALHYLGWAFFKQGDWLLPIGLNPDFGMQISSSIVYTDSIPLLAIFFKLLAPVLPAQFQYFGIWLLICFILQATFAYKLISLFSNTKLFSFFGTAFFLVLPIFLTRVGLHASLVGQFLILAGLYLNLRKDSNFQTVLWALLLIASALVHFYLLAMVSTLWCADLADKTFSQKGQTIGHSIFAFLGSLSALLVTAWLAGYFIVGSASLSAGDYAFGGMNLLSFFNAAGWSYILKPIPGALRSLEGFNYLGLGLIFCFFIAIYAWITKSIQLKRAFYKHRFLVLICGLLAIFALSNQIGIGSRDFTFDPPQFLLYIGGILRSPGRMAWPAIYLLILAILYLIYKGFTKRTAIVILAFTLLIQVIDTSAGWLPISNQLKNSAGKMDIFSKDVAQLNDPFWNNAAKQYQNVVRLPIQDLTHRWEQFASYAAAHHMATNSVYLSRVDRTKVAQTNQAFELAISSGKYDPQSLYIVESEKLLPVAMHLDTSKDLLARINGMYVLAPGWKTCTTCPQVPPEYEIHPTIPKTDKDKAIDFSSKGDGKHFLVGVAAWQIVGWGWAYPEAFGVWSEGDKVKLTIPLPKEPVNDPIRGLELEMRALVSPNYPKQTVEVWVNSQFQKKVILTQDQGNKVLVNIPQANTATNPKQDYVTIELKLPNKAKPKDLGLGDDTRELAIGLVGGVWR